MTKSTKLQLFSWGLASLTVILAGAVWVSVRLSRPHLTAYDVFPLLGLLALGLMWSHYITGALRQYLQLPKRVLSRFFSVTAWIVLVLILLHPSIFIAQLWFDGFGLPPFSYWSVYAGFAAKLALTLGSLSLLAFLAFELHRKFKSAKWWKYIEYANIVAILAIFYHSFTLGAEMGVLWFRIVWLMYLILFIIAVLYSETAKGRGEYE